ncbi:uncharacterized protein LOC131227831 [Magnolia sinica]|uniref:uncharacterized protein LOC131227831 n=1 Tax=Magnolia sinica TaxID=86752 RepID=UPI00265B70DD|nr:uncharacterized protein LOC131227831 [Magnolia sinica]
MEKPSVHQKKNPKPKSKEKIPVKVVYISNPMKVTVNPSKFMALVQGLTGQDSDPADMAKFLENDGVDDLMRIPEPATDTMDDDSGTTVRPIATVDPDQESLMSDSSPFDLYDDVFTTQMLENFTGSVGFFRTLGEE